jgi:hypothetical protein
VNTRGVRRTVLRATIRDRHLRARHSRQQAHRTAAYRVRRRRRHNHLPDRSRQHARCLQRHRERLPGHHGPSQLPRRLGQHHWDACGLARSCSEYRTGDGNDSWVLLPFLLTEPEVDGSPRCLSPTNRRRIMRRERIRTAHRIHLRVSCSRMDFFRGRGTSGKPLPRSGHTPP